MCQPIPSDRGCGTGQKEAPHADWLCAGVHPGAELHAPARGAGAERLCQGVCRGGEWGKGGTPGPHRGPRVCARWGYPGRLVPRSVGTVVRAAHGVDADLTEPADWVPQFGRSDRHHDSHRPVLFSDHGGLCRTRTEPHAGTDACRPDECAPAGTSWGPAQSDRSRHAGDGVTALSRPDQLGAEHLYPPRYCSSDVLSLLSYLCSEEGLEVIENEAIPATLPLVTASLIPGQIDGRASHPVA